MSDSTSTAVELLQRLLLPQRGEPRDVRTLYLLEPKTNKDRPNWDSRTAIDIPANSEVSFQTYFNAFPASYWKRWSQLKSVTLQVQVQGMARVDVYRSKYDGTRIAVAGRLVQDETAEFELSLAPFEDGGWLWFEVAAERDSTITSAGWYAAQAPGPQRLPDGTEIPAPDARVTVGIPTFNRPVDAVAALEALASDPAIDGIIDAVLMPDQGTKHPADEPNFPAVAEHFGDRLRLFPQGNLGGSGGYSRIMYEALEQTDSPFILYMDDDIAIEPDSIARAVQIGRYAREPFIVGGQMLNLLDRSELHSMGEIVDHSTFMWAPAPNVHHGHNFSKYPMSRRDKVYVEDRGWQDNKDMHRRIDVEYNGWWMCMFPRIVAEKMGQPLPLFIKWDDTEYSLRAAKAGYPTVTWPGVAIWHMSWIDKDDAIDWQAYFHLRNRLIVAAMYLDGSTRGLMGTLRKATYKHLVCQEYSTVAIHNEAMKDFLAGPDRLFDILESSLPRINALRKEFTDARVRPSATEFPPATGAPGVPTKWGDSRHQLLQKMKWAVRGLGHVFKVPDPHAAEAPQLNLTPQEARWFALSRVDSATVTTADGSGVVLRVRNPKLAKELGEESFRLRREIERRFDEMRETYRAALPELTSREAWGKMFHDED